MMKIFLMISFFSNKSCYHSVLNEAYVFDSTILQKCILYLSLPPYSEEMLFALIAMVTIIVPWFTLQTFRIKKDTLESLFYHCRHLQQKKMSHRGLYSAYNIAFLRTNIFLFC